MQRFCKVKLSWLWHLRLNCSIQRLTMLTETHHGYRDSSWLQRLTMVTETDRGYRDSQWYRVWALELTSTAVIVFSMRYSHYVMSGICMLIEMRCIFLWTEAVVGTIKPEDAIRVHWSVHKVRARDIVLKSRFVLPVSRPSLIIFWDFYWLRATLNSWKCICT